MQQRPMNVANKRSRELRARARDAVGRLGIRVAGAPSLRP
jgi:hypothetical protein